jgi:signal transduction histidine kinase
MHGELAEVNGSSNDASRNGLEFAHRLLAGPTSRSTAELLDDLAAAFAADGAAVAVLAAGPPLARRSSLAPASRWPWDTDATLYATLRTERSALSLAHPDGGSLLAAAALGLGQTPWLLWLESRRRTTWNTAEAAAFALAAAAVARALDAGKPGWTEQLERLTQLQQLEQAAAAVRRVAHDYGNVLTTILGFSELALAQPLPPGSALHRYLKEVHGGAESGSQLTNQLRLFARRQTASPRPCPLEPILTQEQLRLHAADGTLKIELALPAELPPVVIDGDHLRVIVAALLDNAVEATEKPGTVTVAARTVTIAAEECLDYFGDVQPGPHVEIRIADGGPGLSPDVRRRLFAEPFFSTKPRRRGYGLFAVYGVLCSHKGGLRLGNAPERGTVARVVLPVAVVPSSEEREKGRRGEREKGKRASLSPSPLLPTGADR